MRIITAFAKPGLKLASAVCDPDGKPVMGKGTVLTRRRLAWLWEMEVSSIVVEHDPDVPDWAIVRRPEQYLRELKARFARVDGDKRMTRMKEAVRDTYLDFLTGAL